MLVKMPPDPRKAMIYWRGRLRTIAEACTLAAQEQHRGNFQNAADIYALVLGRVPDCAEAHNNRGAVLQMMEQFEDALASYDKAVALKPDYFTALFNRGFTLKHLNRYEEALASYDKAIALKPDDAGLHSSRGVLLQQMRRYDDAIASYDKAIAANPYHALAYHNRGTVLLSKGDMPEAEKMFRKALKLKPDFTDPLHSLAQMRRYQNVNDADVKKISGLLKKSDIQPQEKEHLYFALGKIYDDCGLYDEAFESFQQANQIRNAFVSYKAATTTRLTDNLIDAFNRDFLARRFGFASESQVPLFVIGMPRSGTTLLANILSNHPAIATAGELPTIPDLASTLERLTQNRIPYPQAVKRLVSSVATRLINDYEKRLRRDVGLEVSHVIDKNPLNFRHLGFISMLFPKATVIHCTRNPLDTGLSNYFQRFPLTLDYSFDLRNIGHFYREYARLMEHWRKVTNLKLIEVGYEDVVLKTEPTIRKMLDYLGLEWDERCLAPHTNPCPVETASQWEVRQPIYRHSLERWRHYEKHLAPLKEALLPGGHIPV
jgi:tetratricopeptide (TPR) repeat protein